jgi:hypothetical protein
MSTSSFFLRFSLQFSRQVVCVYQSEQQGKQLCNMIVVSKAADTYRDPRSKSHLWSQPHCPLQMNTFRLINFPSQLKGAAKLDSTLLILNYRQSQSPIDPSTLKHISLPS